MPAGTRIVAAPEQLDAVRFNDDGLVPAIVQEAGTGQVLMMAWMTAETLRLTLEEGRTVFWSRSRQEVWRKGETSGERQWVQAAYYDCDGDALLFVVDQDGQGACHTGEHSCFFRHFGPADGPARERMIRPTLSRDEFRALARDHTVVPVWSELLADLETPVAAYAKLVGDGTGFLLESVEHGERWSRFSFVGRDPTATLVLRDGRVSADGVVPEACRPTGACWPPSRRCCTSTARRCCPICRRSRAAWSATSATTSCGRSSACPDVPPDDRGLPDAVMSVIGSLAAFDHWRQRAYLIESVPVLGLDEAGLDAAYDAAAGRLERGVADLGRPLPYTPVRPARPRRGPARGPLHDAGRPVPAGRRGGQGAHPRRRHLPGRAGAALRPRARRRPASTCTACCARSTPARTCTSSATPRSRSSARRPSRWCSCSAPKVISRPIAGTRRRGRTDEDDRRMAGELREHPKEIAEHVMLVDLARNDVGRVAQFGTVHVDELMTLERYSHVMHLTSQVSGELRPGLGPIDVLRATLPAGTVSGAPKVRAMEIIDELEPVKRGPYAGVVGYVDFSGNLDTAIAIRTMFVGPKGAAAAGRRRHRGRQRSRPRGPRVPQQGRGAPGGGAGGAAHDRAASQGGGQR